MDKNWTRNHKWPGTHNAKLSTVRNSDFTNFRTLIANLMSRDNRQFGKLAKAYVEKIVLFTGRAVDLNLLMVATWKLTDKATNDKDREISSAIVRQLSTFSGPALII